MTKNESGNSFFSKINHIFFYLKQRKAVLYFVVLFLFLSFSYFHFGTYRNWPYKIESDGKYYYQYLVSAFYDHDFDFSNNYLAPMYPWMHTQIDGYRFRYEINPSTGRPSNVFTVGPAILWSPFFVTAKGIGAILNHFHCNIDTGPWGKYMQYSVAFSAVIYCFLTLILLYKMICQFFTKKIAVYSTWVILVATNLYYYTVFESSMSHVYDLFTFVLFLFFYIKCLQSRKLCYFVSLAISGSLNVLVRTQNILTVGLFSLILIYLLFSQYKYYLRLNVKAVLIYLTLFLAGVAPVPLINKYLYGNPFRIPQGNSFLDLFHPKIYEVLFSERNGLFSQHPTLLLGLIGFLFFLFTVYKTNDKQKILFFTTLLVIFLIQVYLDSSVSDWWGGDAFGQRRLISSFPLFAFGLAYFFNLIETHSPFLNIFLLILFTIAGLYLTIIHVFFWEYDQPHNIFLWMFSQVPKDMRERQINPLQYFF